MDGLKGEESGWRCNGVAGDGYGREGGTVAASITTVLSTTTTATAMSTTIIAAIRIIIGIIVIVRIDHRPTATRSVIQSTAPAAPHASREGAHRKRKMTEGRRKRHSRVGGRGHVYVPLSCPCGRRCPPTA